jgi:UDP-N-acetylmuramoyl-tripeptide--D-alanyl-D-alanine ligase
VIVDDTLEALVKLGQAARQRASLARRGAVTGSVGKTSVTQAIRAGLAPRRPAHSSVKSYNNHIGVPLDAGPHAARRRAGGLRDRHEPRRRDHAADPDGEAARRWLITTVAQAHRELRRRRGRRRRGQGRDLRGPGAGGRRGAQRRQPWFDFSPAKAKRRAARRCGFGSDGACAAQLEASAEEAAAPGRGEDRRRPVEFPCARAGHHWGLMSLCALLMMEALGVDPTTPWRRSPPSSRWRARRRAAGKEIAGGAFTLIDESYNANPVSVAAALRTLGARPTTGRRSSPSPTCWSWAIAPARPRRPGAGRSRRPASIWSSAPAR